MCKAKKYLESLEATFIQIDVDYEHYKKEEIKYNNLQQDILHMIESESFDAARGYYLAKTLKDLRIERRKIKNELYNLEKLRMRTHNMKKQMDNYEVSLEKAQDRQDNPIYNVRNSDLTNVTALIGKKDNKFENILRDFKQKQTERKKYKFA